MEIPFIQQGFLRPSVMPDQPPQRLIFQLGTNNWQSEQEFAPGSGILHEQHHNTFNAMPGVNSHSVFPSRVQRFERPDVRVFELDHDIPICESVSPVSSYRWHSMSEDEFEAYRVRLRDFVIAYIDEVEADLGRSFDLFIAHHAFLNPLVMADVNRERVARGKPAVPLFAFVHGTALLMFKHEMKGGDPEYPPRFYPRWIKDKVFDAVSGVLVISNSQSERFLSIFSDYNPERVFVAPNGIDPAVFHVDDTLERDTVLSRFPTKPYEGSAAAPSSIPPGFDRIVLFVGKFADIKRIDCLLRAAVAYEKVAAEAGLRVATLIAGSGPLADQRLYQDLATDLGLSGAFFIGPHSQPNLAQLYNIADVGVFPTKIEAFGLVFLECMACGTPVIGTAAGGPLEFVDDTAGELVTDFESNEEFTTALGETIARALVQDWKRGKAAAALAIASRYTLTVQCDLILKSVDALTA
ncbi:MAG: glycosyltransferase involved in cell wall biosynthesis [Verrucomicrobiales bacterium]|jgi:glycosyltransferase involved in cell wall biosynthesis